MGKTILDHAKEILYDRKEEKERQYGPFKESMAKAADVASVLAGHKLSANDIYAALIGVKLARQGHANKYDNIVDCIVYLAQMSEELEEIKSTKPFYEVEFKFSEEQAGTVPGTWKLNKDQESTLDNILKKDLAKNLVAEMLDKKDSQTRRPSKKVDEFKGSSGLFDTDSFSKPKSNAEYKKVSTSVKNSVKKPNTNRGRKTRKAAKR